MKWTICLVRWITPRQNTRKCPECYWWKHDPLLLGLWLWCTLWFPGCYGQGEQWPGPEDLRGIGCCASATGVNQNTCSWIHIGVFLRQNISFWLVKRCCVISYIISSGNGYGGAKMLERKMYGIWHLLKVSPGAALNWKAFAWEAFWFLHNARSCISIVFCIQERINECHSNTD